jgi:RNA recognition motif-containing protein
MMKKFICAAVVAALFSSGAFAKIFVGNLSVKTQEQDLKKLFSTYGEVTKIIMLKGRGDGRSKRLAFVKMKELCQEEAAIDQLNDVRVDGRNITVEKVKD